MSTARFVVSGKVQGVFFRASARNEAQRRGLQGHARNLSDGRVEVVASGSDEALLELEQWLQHGPPAARVAEVSRHKHEGEVSKGFLVF
ncbi:acylphosphatase [Dyella nitratireducens]|uniref:acylphosphatase n=1 Tax=Dyella nitratireducens TaxID=1849580 RepID=A0ABQ1FMN7_9GAMM|nr:acylphosphatase [Dyella nitratireducens]GGA21627.1 acylphosphatase [Dyella nitratireducens]GLQ44218.1 acylphosphatase [Dyella nitratireducens]